MNIEQIKQSLARPAVTLITGNVVPTTTEEQSWLGKVTLFKADEGIPLTDDGEPLLPFAQFHLPSLGVDHPLLKGVRLITVFIADPLPDACEQMGSNWVIREYSAADELVHKELEVAASYLIALPLRPERVEADFPMWDGGGMPDAIQRAILALEDSGELDSYYDISTHAYEHKFGGYPSFCQSGIDPGEGFEFVFQISSDTDINLNVVDCGSLVFWKHRVSGEWMLYYDFH